MEKENYVPTAENLKMRSWFRDSKFGMFVHWGVYSVLGEGEWVMHNRRMTVEEYERLSLLFNPTEYDPAEWVRTAKNAGMRYITFTTKHHDGFAMYDSRVSDWDIVDRTPYGKDVLKMLADECRRQDVKLFLYYSLLDWHHTDYYPRGRTGEHSGRPDRGDFNKYIDYVNAQIAELCGGGYGKIAGVWLDGWWDQQLGEPSERSRSTQVDWRLEETYDLIHGLQPQALIGNNHHVAPFLGEDFRILEKEMPKHDTGGVETGDLPLETCETINNSWGYNKSDREFKCTKKLVQCLVRAAGHNANFLLNVGPMPSGRIQTEFVERLGEIGRWMAENGDSIYGTRGGPIEPAENYVSTCKNGTIYLHVLDWKGKDQISVPSPPRKIKRAWKLDNGMDVQIREHRGGLTVVLPRGRQNSIDTVIVLEY